MRRRSRHGRGRGGNFPLLLAGFGPRSRRSDKAEAAPGNSTGTCPGLRGEPGRGGREPALEPWPGGGASLTLVVFLWDVHPRVFIDH